MSYKTFIFALISIIFTLVLLEGIVRLWGYSDRYIYDPIYTLCDKCDPPLVVHKPNLRHALARAMTIIDTDSLGLRTVDAGRTISRKSADEIRIAIVGDSVTFGHGVRNSADVYPAVLENILNSGSGGKNRFRVFNFGVSAYSLNEMVDALKCRMLDVEPDIVICAFIFDDFDPNRMVDVDEYGYTNDRKLGGGHNRFPFFKNLLRRLHITYLVRDALLAARRNKNAHISGDARVLELYSCLHEFRAIASQNGVEYCFILLPSFGSDDFSKITGRLDADHFQYLDLSNMWKEYSLEKFRCNKLDNHPSATVHKEIAARVAAYIQDRFHNLRTIKSGRMIPPHVVDQGNTTAAPHP